jgi:hypothetical protein
MRCIVFDLPQQRELCQNSGILRLQRLLFFYTVPAVITRGRSARPIDLAFF